MSNSAQKAIAAYPAPMVKTDHESIKAKMLAVLAVVLDIQTAYEGYEKPSAVDHDTLEPLWRARVEATGATNVVFGTTPHAKQSWKYVLEVSFVLEIGQCRYKVSAIGADAPNGYNSTAEWLRQVNRWPESEKAMAKKPVKAPVEPRSLGHGATMKQESIDALQATCKKDLEETFAHNRNCAASSFERCKFDGRDVDSIGLQDSIGGFTLWFNKALEGEPRYIQLQGGFEAFESEWIPRFSGDEKAFSLACYRSHLERAEWLGKWIDGMVQIRHKPYTPPTVTQKPVTVDPPQQEATTKPEKAIHEPQLSVSYYLNPKTGLTKSFLVKGDTSLVKDELKEAGGTWCAGLWGWIFGLKREGQFKKSFPTAEWTAAGSTQQKAA